VPNNEPDVKRPWGGYTILQKTKTFWIKKLFVDKNARLSFQSHEHREEVWYILNGEITAQVGNKEIRAQKGEVVHISKRRKHRITGVKKACILEFAFGKVLEHDIVRYDDDYGRESIAE